jgi:hypothetical protein
MREHAIEISTEVFRLVRRRDPRFIRWSEEKPGPSQKILLQEDVYTEFIDRAIAHHQTLDEVIREVCTRTRECGYEAPGGGYTRRVKNSN